MSLSRSLVDDPPALPWWHPFSPGNGNGEVESGGIVISWTSSTLMIFDRARPHSVLFCVWAAVVGFGLLFGVPAPQSIVAIEPFWQVKVWSAALALSGVLGVIGTCWPGIHRATMWMESVAMFLGAGGLFLYVGSALYFAGVRGFFSAGMAAAWMVANLWRARQISHDLKRMRSSDMAVDSY